VVYIWIENSAKTINEQTHRFVCCLLLLLYSEIFGTTVLDLSCCILVNDNTCSILSIKWRALCIWNARGACIISWILSDFLIFLLYLSLNLPLMISLFMTAKSVVIGLWSSQ